MLSFVVIAALHARQPLPASLHVSASSGPITQTFPFPPLAHSSHEPRFTSPLFSMTCALLYRVPSDHRVSFLRVAHSSRKKPGGGGCPSFPLPRVTEHESQITFRYFPAFPVRFHGDLLRFPTLRHSVPKKGGGRGPPVPFWNTASQPRRVTSTPVHSDYFWAEPPPAEADVGWPLAASARTFFQLYTGYLGRLIAGVGWSFNSWSAT